MTSSPQSSHQQSFSKSCCDELASGQSPTELSKSCDDELASEQASPALTSSPQSSRQQNSPSPVMVTSSPQSIHQQIFSKSDDELASEQSPTEFSKSSGGGNELASEQSPTDFLRVLFRAVTTNRSVDHRLSQHSALASADWGLLSTLLVASYQTESLPRARLRTELNKKKVKRAVQYVRFPGGPPPEY